MILKFVTPLPRKVLIIGPGVSRTIFVLHGTSIEPTAGPCFTRGAKAINSIDQLTIDQFVVIIAVSLPKIGAHSAFPSG